jgi:signal transduction histidine kinase
MSHELRTPLNAVLGFSEIIRDEMFGQLGSSHYKEYASDIHASGEHLLGIINDILDLAKIEAGQVELQEERFDLLSIVEPCIRLMRERAEKARVVIQAPEIDNACELWGDKRKFKQILLNLLSNAIKFTDAGGRVTIKTEPMQDGGLRLSVVDTGIGIEAEDLAKVMAPFSQVNSSLTRNHDGTGLGLPLVNSLCTLHGGTLRLDSEVDVGTTATVEIPANRVYSAGADDTAQFAY